MPHDAGNNVTFQSRGDSGEANCLESYACRSVAPVVSAHLVSSGYRECKGEKKVLLAGLNILSFQKKLSFQKQKIYFSISQKIKPKINDSMLDCCEPLEKIKATRIAFGKLRDWRIVMEPMSKLL